MKPLNVDELASFVDTYMKPLLKVAVTFMPLEQFFGVLVGYAVPIARGGGVSDDQMRASLEVAIGTNRADRS